MIPKDNDRERRIDYEAIVDCYNEIERAMGWYYYINNKIATPFDAEIIEESPLNALKKGNRVTVVRQAPEDACEYDMLVEIESDLGALTIPLQQLSAIDAEPKTIEAIEDWSYWKASCYEF